MSSGLVRGSVFGVDEPAGTKVCLSFAPLMTTRAWKPCEGGLWAGLDTGLAKAGPASARPASARLARPADTAAAILVAREAVGSKAPSFVEGVLGLHCFYSDRMTCPQTNPSEQVNAPSTTG